MKVPPMLVGAVVPAATAWLTLSAAARLGEVGSYPLLAAVWSIHYASLGLLVGLQHETTLLRVEQEIGQGRPVLLLSALFGLPILTCAVAAAVGASGDSVAGSAEGPVLVALLATLSVTGGAVLVLVLGQLAAERRERTQAFLLLIDAFGRLIAVVVVVTAWPTPTGLWLAMAVSAWVWLPWGWRVVGGLAKLRAPGRVFARRAIPLMASGAGTSLLLAGMPLLVVLISPREEATPGLLAALVLLRSPFLVGVLAYRPIMLTRFATAADVVRMERVILLVGVLGAAAAAGLAAVAGPWSVRKLAGPDFEVASPIAAALAASGVLMAVAVVLTMARSAAGSSTEASAAWVAAVAMTVTVLGAGGGGSTATALACLVGPTVFLAYTVITKAQSRPREKADSRSWRE